MALMYTVKGMTFSLGGDLEEAGQHFLHSLSKSGIICDAGAEAGCDI
jgi:L-cysteine desulfidase